MYKQITLAIAPLSRIPYSLIALLGRFSIAAIFWKSGQTKVQGFEIDIVDGRVHLGWPALSDSVVALFRDEYRLPLVQPELAALALLGMTATIQLLVYPDAYPTHGVWAAVLLFLVARGAGVWSLDHLISRRLKTAAEAGTCDKLR
jgi:putative oxidoreductase